MPSVQAIIDFFVDLFAALGTFLSAIGSNFGGFNIDKIIGMLPINPSTPTDA